MAFNPDKCLKFTALENSCVISLPASKIDGSHYYFSKDGGVNWDEDLTLINANEVCYVKGTNYPCTTRAQSIFDIGKMVKVEGSIMSLVDDGAGEQVEITEVGAFISLFKDCTTLVSISGDLLPATTLSASCYYQLFWGCDGLTSIPKNLLPAATLTSNCYLMMFEGCDGLTSIPKELFSSVTTLAGSCFRQMFEECDNLTSLSEGLLPFETLASNCYQNMFSKCQGLISIPKNFLPAKTLPKYCYYSMFSDCTGLKSVSKDLFAATSFENYCYRDFFKNCSNLASIEVPWETWPTGINNWVNGVAANGSFFCPETLPQTFGNNNIPTGWKVNPPTKLPVFNTMTFQGNLTAPWNKWVTSK